MTANDAVIEPMREADLGTADRVFRLAFGTYLRLPEPLSFTGDASFVPTRFRADPEGAIVARLGNEVVGSNFAARWGRMGFFGPLSVRPDLWDKGVARRLLVVTMERFDAWGVTHAGLFTFADSAKHVGLYQKFGFAPRFLTAVLSRPVTARRQDPQAAWYSNLSAAEREDALRACRALTDTILTGLDLAREIRSVDEQTLGDTLLLWDGTALAGFAVCHCGAGSEAGSDVCYVKFGCVQSGPAAAQRFDRLLLACDGFAAAQRLGTLVGGVNTARDAAYRALLAQGFRTQIQGIAMHRPNEPGYNRPDTFVLDDWR